MDELKFSFPPRAIANWNGLTTKAVSAESADGFNHVKNIMTVGVGRDMAWMPVPEGGL